MVVGIAASLGRGSSTLLALVLANSQNAAAAQSCKKPMGKKQSENRGWLWGLPRHWVVGKPGAPRASLFLTSFCVLSEFQEEVAFWLHCSYGVYKVFLSRLFSRV